MTDVSSSLVPVDSLTVDALTDDVSDNYVSKTLFAVSEFANVVRAGAKTISTEALLCANLGYGLRLVTQTNGLRQTLLFGSAYSRRRGRPPSISHGAHHDVIVLVGEPCMCANAFGDAVSQSAVGTTYTFAADESG